VWGIAQVVECLPSKHKALLQTIDHRTSKINNNNNNNNNNNREPRRIILFFAYCLDIIKSFLSHVLKAFDNYKIFTF
jgi:hypothetical protein